MKGRKPNLRLVAGGVVAGKCPPPPQWLTAQAREAWQRVTPALHRRGLLAPDTIGTVENYCCAAGMVVEFEILMAAEGRVRTAAGGEQRPHPAFKMQQAAMREARLLAGELGLTPHRRPAEASAPSTDPWEGMLA